ncbi:hypothetical protein AMATHDRAFT_151224 [Amanita thiersii Skay4041]|uniref:Glutamyl-tRNA(Gln) amidotransferase subunit B, mitochondrial n=1 Tax=Amanita thiersii Skay4041 TaxID=703135 RepID=A0A2A9NJF7_9AGAR|nr:hypothetical protein AMATHDRAFT_151224 [Amanita thiersii Skay4041]
MLRFCRPRVCSLPLRRRFHNVREHIHDERWPGWQVIIGIETHAQIKSRQKLFSYALNTDLGKPPNTHVTVFDAAFPGTLPKLNNKCVDLAIRTALALQCNVQTRSSFDRKHYFYSDLPSGYQITQHYAPIALNGQLDVTSSNSIFPVRIKQLQLEQDTAKSTFHARTKTAQIDLNRTGVGLMEIVTEPDIRSPEEAGAYVRSLQALLRAVGASDGNMEQGSLRCDVNVSVNRVGQPPGTRCEIKNLNSVRFMMAAIIYEIHRQKAILELTPDPATATVPQETRGFDENTFETFRLRSKEDAPDYRYMPDPNLGVLVLSEERISNIFLNLPELPDETRARLKEQHGLSDHDIEVLQNIDSGHGVRFDGEEPRDEEGISNGAIAYFDQVCAGVGSLTQRTDGTPTEVTAPKARDPKVVMNWMTHELLGKLAARKESFKDNKLSAAQLGQLLDLIENKIITRSSSKLLLRHMLENPTLKSTLQVAQDLKLIALSHGSAHAPSNTEAGYSEQDPLEHLCEQAVAALPAEVESYCRGNVNVINRIVGRVMKDSRGRADAQNARNIIERLITKATQR